MKEEDREERLRSNKLQKARSALAIDRSDKLIESSRRLITKRKQKDERSPTKRRGA